MPKHIKMNIDIDTYEIYLNSEKPTLNQYEMNKLEGNQKSGKSIFDIKFNESGKPENDGLVEVEVPKVKPSSKSNSPTTRNKKMRGKQWKKDVVMFLQTLIHIIKHFNTTINSKEFTTFLHKINPEIHFSLYLIQLFSTPNPQFMFPQILPLGPISLLPSVQSSPIGNTFPEDVQWRLVPHPSDLLCHPEQIGRVVYRSGHIGQMGGVRLQEEPISWNGFEPPSLPVAKPLHHTCKPKVGSGIGVRPEINRDRISIEAMELDTLQGVRNILLHQAQYLPVQHIRCLWAFPEARICSTRGMHGRASANTHRRVLFCIPKGLAPSLQSIPTSPKAVTAGEYISMDRRSK
jgi:hypothetical protein